MGNRIVTTDNMKIARKRLHKILRDKGFDPTSSLELPFDILVTSQSINDIHPAVQTFRKLRQTCPDILRMDEYDLYADIWDESLLANLLEERLDGSLWNRRIFLVGQFSQPEKDHIRALAKKHHAILTENPAQASLFVLGHKAFAHDPETFRTMLREKAKRPYVKITGRSAFQQKGKEDPPPHKRKGKGRLYFGKANPRSYPDSYVALDLEATSNRFSNKIIEIGMVRIQNGKETASFQSFVNPHEHLKPVITELTGIQDDMLTDAPDIQSLQKDILKFLKDDPVVGHSVQNDMKLLADNLNMPLDNNYIDTCKIALTMMPEREKFSLGSLAADYNLAKSTHRALDDARTSHELLEKFRELFDD